MQRSLLFVPVGDERTASTRCRVLAHLPALERAGFAPRVRWSLDRRAGGATRAVLRALDLVRDVAASGGADLLFLHRKMFPPQLARLLRRRGRPLVLDLDDALDLPPPDAGATPAARFRRNFEATAHAADLVLCGNAELARRVPHDRVEILPTAVDTERFAPGAAPPARGPALGWVGYAGNLRYLEAIAEPLREVARRHAGLRLIVVADRPPAIDGLEIEYRRWSLEREVADFGGIAVGLMPLSDDPWTRGKCAFKALQYMALGIPAVASPVGANREAIETGVSGFLPRDAREWVDALDALLSDRSLAARIAAAGRKVVEERYALDVISPRLVAILERLVGSGVR